MTVGRLFEIVIAANALLFAVGVTVTALSYFAYRSSGGVRSFGYSTLGFGLITIGAVTEPVYQLVIKQDYDISAVELLQLQLLEGSMMAVGFALLFVSVYGYVPGSWGGGEQPVLAEDGDESDL